MEHEGSEMRSFIFYRSFYNALKKLDDADRLMCYDAICSLALEGISVEVSGIVEIVMELIKPQIEANTAKSKVGSKGGRPRKKATFPDEETENLENRDDNDSKIENHRFLQSETIGYEKTKPNLKLNLNNNLNLNKNLNLNLNASEEEEESACAQSNDQTLFDVFETEFGRPMSPIEYDELRSLQEHHSDDLIKLALREAVKNGARSLRYIESILRNWRNANVRTVDEAVAQIEKFQNRKQEKRNPDALPSWYGPEYAPASGADTSADVQASDEDIEAMQKKLRETCAA